MAKKLLDGVNEILRKTGSLDSDAGLLTTLSDSARQTYIDLAVQVINESMDELYSLPGLSKPKVLKESTIILETGVQDYGLKSDLITLRREWNMVDETNNQFITILGDDGYRQLTLADLEQDDTGLPHAAAIRPTDGRLWLDREPTSAENGLEYKYRYDRDLELTAACDEFPFKPTVFRALVAGAAELWKRERHQEFSQGLFDAHLGRAARLLNRTSTRTSWMPAHGGFNVTDPMSNDRQVP